MAEESLRAFIAIELGPELKEALARAEEALRPAGQGQVKWADPEGIHLTLKFLGNVPSSRVQAIGQAMAWVAQRFSPFSYTLGAPGAFPNLRRPRVLWVGLAGETETLARLQRSLEEALAPLGFPGEGRPFSPHLTLGRVREGASPRTLERLGQALASLRIDEISLQRAEGVSLMRSQLTPRGAIYSRLFFAILGSSP